ncbi:MAG: cytochrome P450 [Verrucomicrobiota bacterium]|nr:cytochrome P450 [Verrucomicrobiota bacterium]
MVNANIPVVFQWPAATRWYVGFALDPLQTLARSYATHGPFLKLPYPRVLTKGTPRAFVVAIGPEFNREVLGNPTTWRPVNVGPPGPKNSAVRRLARGILGMTGRQHEHYRRLLVPPIQRGAKAPDMVNLAEEQVDSWPMDRPIDLVAHAKKLVRTFAIGLLFGDDRSHGYPIADMINQGTNCNFSWKIFACPVNIPGTPYHQMMRDAEDVESRIIEWANCKRGEMDPRDLLSIVVNSPDENGCPASNENIVSHTPTLFGAAFETCQNALIWTLILLDQHPQIARELYEELQGSGAGGLPSHQLLMQLPLLAAIVKESMRILPPVPQQFRVAQEDTSLQGYPLARRTKVLLSSFLTNREPDLYPEPDRFRPERWATIDPSPYEYSVFSGGPRGCPGYAFALAILKVAIATIVTRYRIALQPHTRVDYKVGVALTQRQAIPVILHRQNGAFEASSIRGKIRDLVRFPN